MNVSLSVNSLLSQNLFVFSPFFFLTHLFPFISFCFLHTYLITLSFFSSLYKHLVIYLSCIHSDEGLQSETSFHKLFSLQCKTYLSVKLSRLIIQNNWSQNTHKVPVMEFGVKHIRTVNTVTGENDTKAKE